MGIIGQDILLDDNQNLEFLNGDFDLGDSNKQAAGLLFLSLTNDWKENPLASLNLYYYQNSTNSKQSILTKVSKLMDNDGFIIQDLVVKYDDLDLQIKTNAERNRL